MEERTMNGIPIGEVWEKLKAGFPPDALKQHPTTKKDYIPVEIIEKRLNEVVGMENWDFLVDSTQVCRFGKDGRESCVVSGRLVLYDDRRVPVIRSTCGAADCVYPKEGNHPTSVANTVDSAVQDVFKRCAKRFGIARLERRDNGRENPGKPAREEIMRVTVLEPFRALPRGGAKARVALGGKAYELVIWQGQWEMLQERYGGRFRIGGKLNEMTFVGALKEYRGTTQIEFIRLPDKTGVKEGAA